MRVGVRVVWMAALLAAGCGSDGNPDGDDDPTDDAGVDVGDGSVDPDTGIRDGGDAATTKDAQVYVPPPDCGDGKRDESEVCDDGNNLDGDGCAAGCTREEGFNCPATAGACAHICGDGLLVAGEGCDDVNVDTNDGCSDMCEVEQGWSCLGSGAATCAAAACGDGLLAGDETCDDGNAIPGDGCGTTCKVEAGWLCNVAGEACAAERCGDGIRAGDEKCDDGEVSGATKSGDGCTAACDTVEANYSCPFVGGACTRTSLCGNGLLTTDEECDDRNLISGDGCSATCKKEGGWQCTTVGQACTAARCGDAIIAGSEQCEDGNTATGDGCAACKVVSGWACSKPASGNSTCHRTVCRDMKTEGEEACDDGNDVVGDGCSPGCKTEPTCTVGAPCESSCGDGIHLAADTDEECDDGNTRGGDGCSSECKKEQGFVCTDVRSALPSTFPLTVVYRDFIAIGANGGVKHPDFQQFQGDNASLGLVGNQLVGGKPDYTGRCQSPMSSPSGCGGGTSTQQQTTTKVNFDEWYANDPPATKAKKFVETMTMTRVPNTTSYRNPTYGQSLFPLDGRGWVAGTSPREANGTASDSTLHNFGFTTEIHHWFEFSGGEELTFSGDDDVWVFIGGKLALDLGGLHPRQARTIKLSNNGTITCTSGGSPAVCGGVGALGLVAGNVYEMALFHAERHTNQSNFDLTLNGFNAPISVCVSRCGDGIVTSGESCDDGGMCTGGSKNGQECSATSDCPGGACTSNNTGEYGRCNSTCSRLGPHCGDGIKQAAEACDQGSVQNDASYGGCTQDCKLGPKCGDGKVDGVYGEQCDLPSGNVGGYGGCTATCKFGERCGDGVLQSEHEACDDGKNRSAYDGCAPGCEPAPSCGDGVVQIARGEQCDDGTEQNDGHYGGCLDTCKKAPRCGDRVVDPVQAEQCDDGNANDYDGCSATCRLDLVI